MKKRKTRIRTPERKKRKKVRVHPICDRITNSLGLLIFYSLIDLLFFRNELESKILENILIITIIIIGFNYLKSMFKYLKKIDYMTRKKYLHNKAIELVISWYSYKYLKNSNIK